MCLRGESNPGEIQAADVIFTRTVGRNDEVARFSYRAEKDDLRSDACGKRVEPIEQMVPALVQAIS